MANEESFVLDGVALNDGVTFAVSEADLTPASARFEWVSGADVEGAALLRDPQHDNRSVTLKVQVVPQATMDDALAQIAAVRDKLAKASATQGGIPLAWTPATATKTATFDVLGGEVAGIPISWDEGWLAKAPTITLRLICAPYWRGTATDTGTTSSSSMYAVASVTDVEGDVSALGEGSTVNGLNVSNTSTTRDLGWVVWGIESTSRYDTTAASAQLFYEAEERTLLTGASTVAGAAGASGSGSNVVRSPGMVPGVWLGVLSTQASGGGHLSHIGTFRVYARVYAPDTNVSPVSVALEWGAADALNYARNTAVTITSAWADSWRLVDLGLVRANNYRGTQRWEGRIVATSDSAGDTIDVDCLLLVPADDGFGIAQSLNRVPVVTSLSVRDEFAPPAANLNGRTVPSGGTWSTNGSDSTDLAVTVDGVLTRSAGSVSVRYASAGTTTLSTVAAQVSTSAASYPAGLTMGLLVRYTDNINTLIVYRYGGSTVIVEKWVTGTRTVLASAADAVVSAAAVLTVTVDALGQYKVWSVPASYTRTDVDPIISGRDSALATGGALETGKVGLYDVGPASAGITRTYDNFRAWVPKIDAAVFAGRRLEISSGDTLRQDAAGTVWARAAAYNGSYFKLPVGDSRIIVIPAVDDPAILPHDYTSTQLQIGFTPRGLVVPR